MIRVDVGDGLDHNVIVDVIERVADVVERTDGLEAGLVYGSIARGDSGPASDLDVLVISSIGHPYAELRRLVQGTLEAETGVRTQVQLQTMDSAARLREEQPSFWSHLASEGVVALDRSGRLTRSLDWAPEVEALRRELGALAAKLPTSEELDGLRELFVRPLAQAYRVAKAAVMVRLLLQGDPDFHWRTAFVRLAEHQPRVQGIVSQLSGMRPMYEHMLGLVELSEDELFVDRVHAERTLGDARRLLVVE